MSDDKKRDSVIDDIGEADDAEPERWDTIPRTAKRAVYEHIRLMIAQHHKDEAAAALLRDVAAMASPKQTASPIEVMHNVMAMAFQVAIETLEDADEELCPDCGDYHEPDFVHVPATDPKDLS
jgi:hypothetical protein